MTCYTCYPSPIGEIYLLSDGIFLTELRMGGCPPDVPFQPEIPVFAQVARWLESYFAGEAPEIGTLPLAPAGTPFQKQIWEILCRIPQGQLRSYGSIAAEVASSRDGARMSAQAVGQAVGRNPIGIIIPCHRVVGALGQLTGYAGGLEKKIWLLRHEGHNY